MTPYLMAQMFCRSMITLLCLGVWTSSFNQVANDRTQIAWDKWGVPHIIAHDISELFFAQGWAQMHNHANLILELYGSARGRAAEYWVDADLQNDILIHTLGFSEAADQWMLNQHSESAAIITAFVRGLNAYAEAFPERIDDAFRVVLPLSPKDLVMHTMHVVFTRFIAGKDLGRADRWAEMGSNTYAIGPAKSASGNAMLLQNPHLPWMREFLFFESHLMLAGKNMYGATLVGFPGIAIGFNQNLGWSHTNNTLDNADLYELEWRNGKYLLDDKEEDFQREAKSIKVKQEDGTIKTHDFTVLKSIHGPVVRKTKDKVMALRMAGMNCLNMHLQWWRMINSTNFAEFEAALKMEQLPFWNVMYADQRGEIFYLFNGSVPKRSTDDWGYWDRIIPGGRSADVWTEVHSYDDLPKIKNPSNGWLQNANDPPWTSTIPMILNPRDFPGYMAPKFMHFRPQRAVSMMLADDSITFDELINYKLSTRLEFADRILDDLFEAVEQSGSDEADTARLVLENWDRKADIDSKGMVLFCHWAEKFGIRNGSNYVDQWNFEKAHTTPDGLADPDGAVQLLVEAAREVEKKFGRLDVPWGAYYRINYHGINLPANGFEGSLGIFRVASPGVSAEKHLYVGGGDSWVGIIEFGEQVRAKVLLSYGNATQEDSPHRGDQLTLFSRKELRDAWFSKEEVKAHTIKLEVLQGNEFKSE